MFAEVAARVDRVHLLSEKKNHRDNNAPANRRPRRTSRRFILPQVGRLHVPSSLSLQNPPTYAIARHGTLVATAVVEVISRSN